MLSMQKFRQPFRHFRSGTGCTLVTAALIGVLLSGCNNGSSDALNVMQSNADATIGALSSNLGTAQITLTAMSTMATQLAQVQDARNTLQAEYDQAITQLNGNPAPTLGALNSVTLAPVLTPNPQNVTAPPTVSSANITPAGSNAFVMEPPTTAKGFDSNGCPVNPSTSFTTSDAKIYVIAKVHNLKKGTVFNASWTGTPQHQDTWTATYNAAVTCVHFYVDPKALGMVVGTWTVSLGVADAAPQTTDFKLQDASLSVTATATKSS